MVLQTANELYSLAPARLAEPGEEAGDRERCKQWLSSPGKVVWYHMPRLSIANQPPKSADQIDGMVRMDAIDMRCLQ